jgi:hypothetical protein
MARLKISIEQIENHLRPAEPSVVRGLFVIDHFSERPEFVGHVDRQAIAADRMHER